MDAKKPKRGSAKGVPSAKETKAALKAILNSPRFLRSDRLRALLKYLVARDFH